MGNSITHSDGNFHAIKTMDVIKKQAGSYMKHFFVSGGLKKITYCTCMYIPWSKEHLTLGKDPEEPHVPINKWIKTCNLYVATYLILWARQEVQYTNANAATWLAMLLIQYQQWIRVPWLSIFYEMATFLVFPNFWRNKFKMNKWKWITE